MIEVLAHISELLLEFRKGGLLVFLMAIAIAYLLIRGWFDRKAAAKVIEAKDAKYDAMLIRMMEKHDETVEKYNKNMIHSTRQTETYSGTVKTLINEVVNLKSAIEAILRERG